MKHSDVAMRTLDWVIFMQSKESKHNDGVACLHHKKMKSILLNDGKPWTKSEEDWIKSEEKHYAPPKPEKAKPKGKAKDGKLVACKKDSKDSMEEVLRGIDGMAIVEKTTTLKVVKKSS
jgi:hypothetical protein